MINESEQEQFSPRTIKAALEDAARVFVKVWPLQTFIACNPLSAYEALAFDRALETSKPELGWVDRLEEKDFRYWYTEGAMTLKEITSGFERHSLPAWNVGFRLAEREIRLKDILLADLLTVLKPPATITPDVSLTTIRSAAEFTGVPQNILADDNVISLAEGAELLSGKPITEELDEQTVKWLSAYLDKGQAMWPMPNRNLGLRAAWQNLVVFDNSLDRESRNGLKMLLATLPQNSYEALGVLFKKLEVPAVEIKRYMRWHFARLPGWVGYMRWYIEQMEQLHVTHDAQRVLLADYLILRLCTEWALCAVLLKKQCHCSGSLPQIRQQIRARVESIPGTKALKRDKACAQGLAHRLTGIRQELALTTEEMGRLLQNSGEDILAALKTFDQPFKSKIFREALEATYQSQLLEQVKAQVTDQESSSVESTPMMQAVFCIDNRSERYRLRLEACGNIQTLGFAGFFGIPTRLKSYGENFYRDLCPILMSPRYTIKEIPIEDKTQDASRYLEDKKKYGFWKYSFQSLMKNSAAMFAYVEAFGLAHAALMLKNTLFPGQVQDQSFQDVRPELSQNTITPGRKDVLVEGITLEEQAYYAEAALSMMGLTHHFSPVVVFCGHGSQTVNNPYQSSLDCGACGGNAGGSSARILSEVLNNAAVRNSLAARGILIPQETVFLAAEHDTVSDEVTFLNLNQYQNHLSVPLAPILDAFRQASELNRNARSAILPALKQEPISKNAIDWSQVRPEWGTAGNASFIIGPRSLTENLDLKGRAFLHSYDYRSDLEGKSLEGILTGPLVVAQWINAQYLFSALDNERFGSGSKTIHNVVGRFGVLRGNASDLQIGLPLQTLMANHSLPYHEPLRLTAVVSAPRETVDRIIRRQSLLRNLFNNQWIFLFLMDPESGDILKYCPDGAWKPWRERLPIQALFK